MKSLLLIFLLPLAQAQVTDAALPGLVAGTLTGTGAAKVEQLAGVWVILNRLPQAGEKGFTLVERRTRTAKDGTYSFVGLPLGQYDVCPQIPDSLYLSPCNWPQLLPESQTTGLGPLALLTAASPVQALNLTMVQGAILNIRIEDTGRQIENLQRTREERAAYVGVVLASGRHSPASPLGSRNGIHIYSIVVPPGLSLRPVFEGPSVNLEDVASRQPLAQGRGQSIALDARGGPREVVLRVTGAKL